MSSFQAVWQLFTPKISDYLPRFAAKDLDVMAVRLCEEILHFISSGIDTGCGAISVVSDIISVVSEKLV